MKSTYLPWLLVALAGVTALVVMGDPSGGNEKTVDPVARGASIMRLRTILPRKVIGHVGNADLFGVAAAEMHAAAPSVSIQQGEPRLIEQPSWNVIGKHLDGSSGWSVFLARDEQTLIVRAGDVLDDGHQIVSIVPPVMILHHMKRNTRKTLEIGEATK